MKLTKSILAMLKNSGGYGEINEIVSYYQREENGGEFKGDVLDAIGELRRAGQIKLYGPDNMRGVKLLNINRGLRSPSPGGTL